MSFWDYCCNNESYTSYQIGCEASGNVIDDPIFYHIDGRIPAVQCQYEWKSIGNQFAIDQDGKLWSLVGLTGVGYFNEKLPFKNNFCQVSPDTDWKEIIKVHSENLGLVDFFKKNDDSLWTFNNRHGINIIESNPNRSQAFPIENEENLFFLEYPIDNEIGTIETIETLQSGYSKTGQCPLKITISSSSSYIPDVGDFIITDQYQGIRTRVVKKLSDSEFLIYKPENFDFFSLSGEPLHLIAINTKRYINEYLKQFTSKNLPEYTFLAEKARTRLSSRINKYIYNPYRPEYLPNDIEYDQNLYDTWLESNNRPPTMQDVIQFSREPTLHIKYYKPNIYNNNSNGYNADLIDLDSDNFLHQCDNYIREENIHYYHKEDLPLEEIQPFWRGQIDWIIAKPSGAGYFSPPILTLIPQDDEIVTSGMSPSGLISVLPPTGIVTIDDNGTILDIKMMQNPYVWKKPPKINLEYTNPCIGSYNFTLKTFTNQVNTFSTDKLPDIESDGVGGSLNEKGWGFMWDRLDMLPTDDGTGLFIDNIPVNTSGIINNETVTGFGNYTISIRCSLSPVTGYNKLVGNIYIYNGSLQIHTDDLDIPLGGNIKANTLTDIVFTRNKTNNLFSAYINNEPVSTFTDNNFITLFPASEPIVFFKEIGSLFAEMGMVQKIKVWNSPIDSVDISKTLDYPDFIEASGICEIIGPIQGLNIVASGDGYSHAGRPDSKLVLVAQAHIDDLFVHGIPLPVTQTPFATPSVTSSKNITRTPTQTSTQTPTPTPTLTPTRTVTPSVTISITPTKSITPTSTPSYSPTPIITNTPTVSPTPVVSFTPTPSVTVSNSATPAITSSPTKSIPVSPTASVSSGQRIGSTPAIAVTPTATQTPPPSPSRIVNVTATPSPTPTITTTKTASVTPTVTKTSTLSPTPYSPTPTQTVTPSNTFTPTNTITPTNSATSPINYNITRTPTTTPSPTLTLTPSATTAKYKPRARQWIFADIELYGSEIDIIELTEPLYTAPITICEKDSSVSIDNNRPTLPNPISSNIEGILGWSRPENRTFLFPTLGGEFNPYLNWANSSFNFLTPLKTPKLYLHPQLKYFLNQIFSHPDYKTAYIYGPGKNKINITSSNINDGFDFNYQLYHILTSLAGRIASIPDNLRVIIEMEKNTSKNIDQTPPTPPQGADAYVRFGDTQEPNWAMNISHNEVENFNGNEPNQTANIVFTISVFPDRPTYIGPFTPYPSREYFTEAGPYIIDINSIQLEGANKRNTFNDALGNPDYIDAVVSWTPSAGTKTGTITASLDIQDPSGRTINISKTLKYEIKFIPPPIEFPDSPGSYSYKDIITKNKYYQNPNISYSYWEQSPDDPVLTNFQHSDRNIVEIPQQVIDDIANNGSTVYNGRNYDWYIVPFWQGRIDAAKNNCVSSGNFMVGLRFCDIFNKSTSLHYGTKIDITGDGTTRTYDNGYLTANSNNDIGYIEIPTDLQYSPIYAEDPFYSQDQAIDFKSAITSVSLTGCGNGSGNYDIIVTFHEQLTGDSQNKLAEYVDKVKIRKATVSANENYKYYYEERNNNPFPILPALFAYPLDFNRYIHDDPPLTKLPIPKPIESFPRSKEEKMFVYFPYNSYGSGAIGKFNAVFGPSGYIICDSIDIIRNNYYITEPTGMIKTTGYDYPIRIGSSANNFIDNNLQFKSVSTQTITEPYRSYALDNLYALSNDDILYNILLAINPIVFGQNILSGDIYKTGFGVKFNISTNNIVPASWQDSYSFDYVVSSPEYPLVPTYSDTIASVSITGISATDSSGVNLFSFNNQTSTPILLTLNNSSQPSNIGHHYLEPPEIRNLGLKALPVLSNIQTESGETLYSPASGLTNTDQKLNLEPTTIALTSQLIEHNIILLKNLIGITTSNDLLSLKDKINNPTINIFGIVKPLDGETTITANKWSKNNSNHYLFLNSSQWCCLPVGHAIFYDFADGLFNMGTYFCLKNRSLYNLRYNIVPYAPLVNNISYPNPGRSYVWKNSACLANEVKSYIYPSGFAPAYYARLSGTYNPLGDPNYITKDILALADTGSSFMPLWSGFPSIVVDGYYTPNQVPISGISSAQFNCGFLYSYTPGFISLDYSGIGPIEYLFDRGFYSNYIFKIAEKAYDDSGVFLNYYNDPDIVLTNLTFFQDRSILYDVSDIDSHIKWIQYPKIIEYSSEIRDCLYLPSTLSLYVSQSAKLAYIDITGKIKTISIQGQLDESYTLPSLTNIDCRNIYSFYKMEPMNWMNYLLSQIILLDDSYRANRLTN